MMASQLQSAARSAETVAGWLAVLSDSLQLACTCTEGPRRREPMTEPTFEPSATHPIIE
jgi:hypothetical protein